MPRLHSPEPPLCGRLKTVPADFVVDELPAYLPSGAGEHLFLWIEKNDVSAESLLKHVVRTLGIPQGDIGSAGMKDRRAITRQWLSVPARSCPDATVLETDRIRVLEVQRHGNKLRTGHLTGNRFTIVVRDATLVSRDAERSALRAAANRCDEISRRGFPNYYGDQRFGRDGETLQLGFNLLTQRKSPRDIPYARRRFLLKLALSAAQSELFNRALAERIVDGLVETVLAGDVMEVVASGGKFVAEDSAIEQPRCDAYETVITGPMFGPKTRAPTGIPAERERRLLEGEGLQPLAFAAFGDLLSGTRRAYLVRPRDLSVAEVANGLCFQFTLPPGVYATMLLRELVMTEEAQR
jgi:tRNA pseudouridine13 synthase